MNFKLTVPAHRFLPLVAHLEGTRIGFELGNATAFMADTAPLDAELEFHSPQDRAIASKFVFPFH